MKTSKHIWLFLLAFSFLKADAQITNSKGSNSLIIRKKKAAQNTKAVIIGVSDYQDPDIPDLKYAHKDAEAYAEYLMSPAGGKIPKKNIKLFLNDQATGGNVHGALDWLVKNTKKDEQCLIYFSGHGDVETLYEKEPGHFLVYDTPSETYQVNSLRIEDLQKIITQLSNEIGAKVTVITDACRSGKLAGSDINGAQATAAALLQQFANEIKIMSCQADEYSFEGEQWGGGRGMFSYHMIKGLIGLADNNEDKEVSLKELQRHLEDQFELDLYDGRQTPVMIGDRRAAIAKVNPETYNSLLLEEDLVQDEIAIASTSQDEINQNDPLTLFYEALKEKRLIASDIQEGEDEGFAAIDYLQQLEQSGADPSRTAIAKGDLIAALQDDAQQAINQYLALDPKEIERRWKEGGSDYDTYAQYLGTAANLLAEYHYIYPQVKAKELYFEVVSQRIDLDRMKADSSAYAPLVSKLEQALVFQPRSPFINNEMGLVLMHMKKYDEAIEQFKTAIEISPTWAMPYNNIGYTHYLNDNLEESIKFYTKTLSFSDNLQKDVHINLYNSYIKLEDFKNAENHALALVKFLPENSRWLNNAGYTSYKLGNVSQALILLDKSIQSDSNNVIAYFTKADIYRNQKEYENAIFVLKELLPKSNNSANVYYDLGRNYSLWNKSTDAKIYLTRSIHEDSKSYARVFLSWEYLKENRTHLARKELNYFLENVNSKDPWVHFFIACVFAMEDNLDSFQESMNLAINYGFDDKKEMEESIFLSSIRHTEVYQQFLSQLK